jgi:hypothetical protein
MNVVTKLRLRLMNLFHRNFLVMTVGIFGLALPVFARAAENPATIKASELASRLSVLRQNGSSYVRLRLEVKGASSQTLQLQIKERRTKNGTEVVYQVLWPKERKGESVLLRMVGNRPASGAVFVPPNQVNAIDDLKAPLLGSDLAYADVIEDFFSWDQQVFLGTEEIDRVSCQIIESKPGKSDRSIYGSVRSWVDMKRLLPLRVEKYSSSGQLLRRIDSTRVVSDDGGYIPATLTVSGVRPSSSSIFEGSRIKHDVSFTDRDFTNEGIKDVASPRGAGE